ncbi:uncharacterized protein [Musca autumnalis]|uniref:uncharacterized protein n=1 Tax=Musca autumnalis TaxID=221902 RepID=UPI003CE858F9
MGRTQFTRGLLEFQFEIDDGNCAIKWNSWLRGFELFATANRITDCDEKYSWLLHYAGTKVQEVFFNLPHTEDYVKRGALIGGFIPHLNKYDDAVMKLQNFFAPKRNATYERHIFRKMKQEPNERIELFAVRLRTQAERCNFGNQIESNIKDQITEACSSDLLRRKILERGDDSLDEILKMARIIEAVSEQQKSFRTSKSACGDSNSPNNNNVDVCKIGSQDMRKRQFRSNQNSRFECYRCGTKGHKANDNRCPAKGKECSKCGGKNHFARKCMTTNIRKRKRNEHYDENDSRYKSLNRATGNYETERVQMVSSMEEYDDNADDNVFCISTYDSSNEIRCQIGGVETTAIIDSGSKYNVVDRENWMDLKSKNVNVIGRQKQTDKTFTAYGGKPLKLMGLFKAMVQIDGRSTIADFYVVDEKGKLLLGRDTAMCLQVLKIGNNINQVTGKTDDHQLGKIAGIIVHIPIKENLKPIVQPYRRIPAPLEEAVDKKIQEMLRQGIIEKVNGPSKWVSPVVVVPKRDDIRLCVDMRRANEAFSRENHPLPTIDDFLPHIGTGKFFSKLDIKQAFHQVEIAPDSREITTFITKRGLYLYTRLMFGITCAPEIFQKIMEQVLNGCDGCLNFIDDIIVYAETKDEHDRRLKKVFDRLRKFNVTLNIKKCVIGVSELEFLGHRLSPNGITPTFDKVDAIKRFREPSTSEEVRSFLGLVNYVGKFIPNLATITDPLRKLTHKDTQFEWSSVHAKACNDLKRYMSTEKTLGYYSTKDRTQIIADASPVGLGAVLIQFNESGPRIISYAGRSLSAIEKRYAQTEKEALALVWAVERFHYYVYGKLFELVTDHKPLETIFAPRSKPCARMERWVLRLQSYR